MQYVLINSEQYMIWLVTNSTDVFNDILLKEYHCFEGPVTSFLMTKFEHRKVALFGGIVSSAGLLMSSFAKEIWHLYLTYGLITGESTSRFWHTKNIIMTRPSSSSGFFENIYFTNDAPLCIMHRTIVHTLKWLSHIFPTLHWTLPFGHTAWKCGHISKSYPQNF